MTASPRTALSCSWQLQRVLHGALQRAHPSAMELASSSQIQLPPFLGVRRSMQANADYQSSVALMLGNRLRIAPDAFATTTLQNLHDDDVSIVRDAFVSKGGFVNFVLQDKWLASQVVDMATLGVTPTPFTQGESKSVLVDFCAPNYGKKLHVGHLRSSVIGDTISNLLEFRGHRVARISHTGDVGSAFATLLVELIDNNVPLDTLTDAQLGQYYESGKKKIANNDTAFKQRVDDVVIQLQRIGSEDARTLTPEVEATWKRACEVSKDAYAQIFGRLRVNVQERGESTYLKLIPDVISQLKDNGLAVKSRGALCIFLDGPDKPPMLIQKEDGGFLYATVDLACLHSRIFGFPGVDNTQYDEIVYVTDQSQQLHFQHLFQAADRAGWLKRDGENAPPVKLTHAWFGLVLGKDGSKLSSRNGAFDYLEDLLNEAGAECQRRSVLSSDSRSESDSSQELNRRIGDAAVRYFDLAQQRERNYKFLFDNVLSMKGNTGVYLMYASARLNGILRRARDAHPGLSGAEEWSDVLKLHPEARDILMDASHDWEPSERALAMLLAQFDDEVTAAVTHMHPHYLCDYLFRVVSHFHGFYEKCRVLGGNRQESRLLLCAATHAVLARGLDLVGIEAVKRM